VPADGDCAAAIVATLAHTTTDQNCRFMFCRIIFCSFANE
jgi:hypothetical protein